MRKGFPLPRDCEVTIVPAGHRTTLPKGERVTLMQALGGTATIKTREGEMARLSRNDSIEFGFIDAPDSDDTRWRPTEPFSVDRVWEAATTVYDPEIPVDIVELGLVYRVDAEQLASRNWRVEVDMSVTAPFCGMGDILRQDLHDAVAALERRRGGRGQAGLRPAVDRIASVRRGAPRTRHDVIAR